MLNNYTILSHLHEIKYRVAYIAFGFLVSSGVMYAYSYTMLDELSMNYTDIVISTNIAESFLSQLKLSFVLGLIVTFPVLHLQLYFFIHPGLYPRERNHIQIILLLSCAFYLSFFLVSTFLVYPSAFKFFSSYQFDAGSTDIVLLPRIRNVVNFYVSILAVFCVLSQLPVVGYILVTRHYITSTSLLQARKIYILLSFIAGAIFSPPDVLSQILIAGTLILFYETMLFYTLYIEWKATRV